MCENNITPAIKIPNDAELSAEEFQQRLYGWFQERGLLTELRAHLRKQMIGVLKDSPVGHTVTGQQKQCLSPKVQALNLLIGEFLLYNNYHYSLSVFSTEVPAISVLPEFPLSSTSSEQKTKNKQWRFMEKDMCDLLETLGIARESDLGEKVFQSYYKNDTEPLLTNIINCIKLTNKTVQSSPSCANVFTCTSYEEWIKNIGELLHINNISTANIKDVLNTIMNLVETERKRIKKETLEEFLKNKVKLEEEFAKKHEEQTKKWTMVTNSLEREKSKLLNEQARKQMEMEQFSVKILKHQNVLQDRYHNLIMREREVHKREYHMKQREECLETQQQRLQIGFDSLYHEQKAVADLQKKLQQELNEQRAKFNVTFFDNIQKVMNDNPSAPKENREEAQGEIEDADKNQNYQQELIVQLQIENRALQSINSEQKVRIDELTERSSLLLRDLESTQAAVNILSTSSTALNGVLTTPPLLPPTSYSFDRSNARSVRSGGGEDGSRAISPPSSREFRNVPNSRDIKRRLPPRRISGFSSSTSDEATTSQILQDARDKLRRLEEESEEVDRHYQRFKIKREQDIFSSLPCRYRTFQNAVWLSDFNKEQVDKYDSFETPQKPSTSSSSLMEYVPYKKHFTTIRPDIFECHSSGHNSNKAGPSNAELDTIEKIEDTVCKDIENSSSSSGLDLGTSGVSFSHVDSSEEKTTTEQ